MGRPHGAPPVNLTFAPQTPMTVPAVRYVITGTDCRGRRFKVSIENYHQASYYNIWRGNLWEIQEDGHRKRIRSWYN